MTVKEDTLVGVDSTCPICLNDMAIGEHVRLLSCKHVFHSQVSILRIIIMLLLLLLLLLI